MENKIKRFFEKRIDDVCKFGEEKYTLDNALEVPEQVQDEIVNWLNTLNNEHLFYIVTLCYLVLETEIV